jgi:hypothetical protein
MLQAYSLASLSDFRDTLNIKGSDRYDIAERAIATASRLIETETGYRLRYRAPEEVSGAANLVASATLANGALSVAAQPDSAGRTVVLSLVDTARLVSDGTVTVTGTVGGTAGQTEVFQLADGPRQHGRKFFSAVSAVTVAGYTTASNAVRTIKLGTSVGMTEYHTLGSARSRINLLERIYAIAEVNEDYDRLYAAATALTTSQYEIVGTRTLQRVLDRLPDSWETGYRAIKVRYSGGFGGISTLPSDLVDICIRVAGPIYQEWTRGTLGVQSQSDQLGNFTRWSSARLSDDIKSDLAPYRRGDIFDSTGERDFELDEVTL